MTVQSLPGCCGVLVVHSFTGEVKPVVEFIKTAMRAAKRAGYGQVLFTLRSDSAILESFPQEPVTGDNGDGTVYYPRAVFRNGKTNNMIALVTINLEQPERTVRRNDTAGE